MKVEPAKSMYLQVTYNKSDFKLEVDGKTMEREFTIRVDDVVIATEQFNSPHFGELYAKSYQIPDELISDKKKVTITFSSEPGKIAGSVYFVRMLNERSL